MTISEKDLFMAILSIDAYHRGYDRGISLPDSSTIGNATIINTGPASGVWVAAGFYAAAYNTQWGTVISNRGRISMDYLRQSMCFQTPKDWLGDRN